MAVTFHVELYSNSQFKLELRLLLLKIYPYSYIFRECPYMSKYVYKTIKKIQLVWYLFWREKLARLLGRSYINFNSHNHPSRYILWSSFCRWENIDFERLWHITSYFACNVGVKSKSEWFKALVHSTVPLFLKSFTYPVHYYYNICHLFRLYAHY